MTKNNNKLVFGSLLVVGIAAVSYYFWNKDKNKLSVEGGTSSHVQQVAPPMPTRPCRGGWELYKQWYTGRWAWRCKGGLGDVA